MAMRITRKAKHRSSKGEEEATHICDAKDCHNKARFRAPYSRDQLNKFHWFCLPHIREYNARWNYYKGMSEEEIEVAIHDEPLGFRPTRPFSSIDKSNVNTREREILESLKQFMYFRAYRAKAQAHRKRAESSGPRHLSKALKTLGLQWPITFKELRVRYIYLVKLHHPDRNQNDARSEEYIKEVNTSFSEIKKYLDTDIGAKT